MAIVLLMGLLLGGCHAWPVRWRIPTPPPTAIPTQTLAAGEPAVPTLTQLPTATPGASVPALRRPTPTSWHLDSVEQARALLPWAQGELAGSWDNLTHYHIELSVDVERLHIQGREWVRYTNDEAVPLNEVVFRLFPQTPGYGGQMSVDEALLGGQPATTRMDFGDSALYLVLPQALHPGHTVTFELAFRIAVPEGSEVGYSQFSYANGILALPNAYPLIPVYDDEGWNVELAPEYGDAVYSDVAVYHVQVRAPSEQVVVTSGSTIARVESGDGTATTTSVSGPMREFMIVMSTEFVTSTATVDGTLVTSYYLPQDVDGGDRALGYAVDALEVFGEHFGSYPYAEFDVVETATTAGGIEYPGLVVVAQRLYEEEGGFFEFATVHEVAHQWWYGMVGSDQVDEPWLDEALTQYSTLLYYEEVRGPEVAEGVRKRTFEQPYERLLEEGRDSPVGQPVRAFSREDYGPVVYGKGPLFFEALRDEVGDEAFLAILRAYCEAYRYKIATPQGFLTLAEEVSSQELGGLHEKWILSPGP